MLPFGQLIARREEILSKIAASVPWAFRFSLAAVQHGMDAGTPRGLALESAYFAMGASLEDQCEGTSAFLPKRAPKFEGVTCDRLG